MDMKQINLSVYSNCRRCQIYADTCQFTAVIPDKHADACLFTATIIPDKHADACQFTATIIPDKHADACQFTATIIPASSLPAL
jgi:hypothetical protein